MVEGDRRVLVPVVQVAHADAKEGVVPAVLRGVTKGGVDLQRWPLPPQPAHDVVGDLVEAPA